MSHKPFVQLEGDDVVAIVVVIVLGVVAICLFGCRYESHSAVEAAQTIEAIGDNTVRVTGEHTVQYFRTEADGRLTPLPHP